jgi:hypothetical protein
MRCGYGLGDQADRSPGGQVTRRTGHQTDRSPDGQVTRRTGHQTDRSPDVKNTATEINSFNALIIMPTFFVSAHPVLVTSTKDDATQSKVKKAKGHIGYVRTKVYIVSSRKSSQKERLAAILLFRER